MLAGAEHEGPLVSLRPRWQVTAELFPVLITQDLRRADEVRHDDVIVQGNGTVRVERSPELLAHRQYLRKRFVINMSEAISSESVLRRHLRYT